MTTPHYTVTSRSLGGWSLRCFGADGVEVMGGVFASGHRDSDYLDAYEAGEAFLAEQRAAGETNGANLATSAEGQADGDRLAGVGPALRAVSQLFGASGAKAREQHELMLTPLQGSPGVSCTTSFSGVTGSMEVVLWLELGYAKKFWRTGFWVQMPGGVDVFYSYVIRAAGRAVFAPVREHQAHDPAPRSPDVWLLRPTARHSSSGELS